MDEPEHTVYVGRPVHGADVQNVSGFGFSLDDGHFVGVNSDGNDGDVHRPSGCFLQRGLVLIADGQHSVELAHQPPLVGFEQWPISA
jgi:hypothetical protein